MSITWNSDVFGNDGDRLYGRIEVSLFETNENREKVVAEIDRQCAEFKEQALAYFDREYTESS